MKTITFLRKSMGTLALALTLGTGALAQTTITLTDGENYSSNIDMNTLGNTTLTIAEGETATISGVISGGSDYTLTKEGAGTIILTKTNTYYGPTVISGGKLQIGDGTTNSSSISEWALNSPTITLDGENSVLRFEPYGTIKFARRIFGNGKVEYKGTSSSAEMYFTTSTIGGGNTYTGTTTIEAGRFHIGDKNTLGNVAGDIIVKEGAYLYFDRSNEYTYSGVISGAGNVSSVNNSTGKTILTGVNTYTGQTSVSYSTLQIGDGNTGSIAETSQVQMGGSGTLRFEPGAAMTFSKQIYGTGHLVYKGTATKKLILTANNNYFGTTTVEEGILQIGNGNTGAIINTDVTVNTNGILRFEPGAGMFFSKVISGDGKVEYKGTLTNFLVLTGDNEYTGTTTIDGDFYIGDNTPTGSVKGDIIINAGYLTFARSNEYTYSGKISGGGEVWQYGHNKIILTGVNTYTGRTVLGASSGTLQIGDGTTSGSIASTSGVNMQFASSTLRFEPSGNMTFSKPITGAGKVEIKNDGKDFYLTGDNTYEGTTTIQGGRLGIGYFGTTGSVKGNIILYDAASSLFFLRSNEYTYTGVISGDGDVWQNGGSKTILTGVNTYKGKTYVHNGTLQIGNGTSGSINSTSTVEVVFANSTLRFEPGVNTTFSKVITGKGKMECKSRGSILLLTGDNTYEGTTTIDGELYIGNYTPTGSVAGDIVFSTDGGPGSFNRAVFNRSNEYTYSGVISGEGEVLQQGSGKLILTGANTYTGQTYVRTTLQIGNYTSGSIYNTANVYLADASATLRFEPGENMIFSKAITGDGKVEYRTNSGKDLWLSGENTYKGTTTVENGRLHIGAEGTTGKITGEILLNDVPEALYFNRSNEYTHTGVISGKGIVVKQGGGKTILTGVNTYTGTTYVDAGTLQIGDGNTGSIDNTQGVNALFTGTLRFEPGAELTFPKPIYGQGKLEYKGTAAKKLILTALNQYEGSTTVEDGILQISSNDNMINTSEVALTGANATLRFEPDATMTFSKVISGSGKVEYSGSNTKMLYFTGENTYTGTTTIGGYLYIGDGGTKGKVSGNIIVNAGWLRFNRSDNYTYTGVISGGGGIVVQESTGKTILTGVNTYTGATLVNTGGTLQIGNGTSGSINNTSGVTLSASNSTLRFEPGAAMTFSKEITGNGTVEYKGTSGKTLTLTENNTPGVISIEAGNLIIGNGGTSGSITNSNVSVNSGGSIHFNRSDNYTYTKIISGAGGMAQIGTGTLTLGNGNGYTGVTEIRNGGTLALGASGSIALSSNLLIDKGNFDISAGNSNKTVKNISSSVASGMIYLGGNSLFIGTSDQSDGGGNIGGIITGTGGVIKTGSGTLALSIPANATGTFSLRQGAIEVAGGWVWAGNFFKATGTKLTVQGEMTVNGNFALQSGDIHMNLTTSPPSKITALGTADVSGTTTLHIVSGAVTNQVLIQAASGLSSTTPFKLDMPGYNASLNATGTQLQLTATVTDVTPPVPGAGVNGSASYDSANLTWTAATDNETPQASLRYFVYQSASNNITTAANCEANGTLLNPGGTFNITDYEVTGLSPQTTCYFNVVVADMTNNKAAYTPKELITAASGIEDISAGSMSGIQVYPNPFTDVLHITGAEGCTLRVLNISGLQFHTRLINSTGETIDLQQLPAGVYFLHLEKDRNVRTVKAVKK